MNAVLNLFLFISLIISIVITAVFRLGTRAASVKQKIMKAEKSPWTLHEFLTLQPNKSKPNDYYKFDEGTVRSHTYRFVGRFDSAIFHWEDVPILDIVIERKFPVSYLPDKVRNEDIFQCGLYSLALEETGVSCRDTKLVIIYCLQDVAKACLEGNSQRNCLICGEGKIYTKQYNKREIEKQLRRINEVWYKKRRPRASASEPNCRPCPYSKNGKCNYSWI